MFDSLRICLLLLKGKAKFLHHRLRSLRRAIIGFARKQGRGKSSLSFTSDGPSIPLAPTPSAGGVSAQFRQVFELIDSDGDGKISPSELGSVLSRLAGYSKKASLHEALVMVREMDSDGDGLVDLDEFLGAVAGGGRAVNQDEEEGCLRDAFSIYDTNGDGRISAEELRRVLAGLGISNCSIRDCRSMIGGFDRDGDGYVDFEEFRSMMI